MKGFLVIVIGFQINKKGCKCQHLFTYVSLVIIIKKFHIALWSVDTHVINLIKQIVCGISFLKGPMRRHFKLF